VFFARDHWVADHADWQPRIQMGKTIDILHGDGQRILAECLERTARLRPETDQLVDELRRYGAPQTVQPRLGQGIFRIAVTSAYRACAVSGEHSLPALEAAHVRPYADGGAHALPNGLLLRADIHRLYDAGNVTVTLDYRLRVSHDLADAFRRRPRLGALRRPRHHRAACAPRSARPRVARRARGRGLQGVSVTQHGRSSSLCGSGRPSYAPRRHRWLFP